MKITDPVAHAHFTEEIAKIERAFEKGEIDISHCSDLVRYLRTQQRKLEVHE